MKTWIAILLVLALPVNTIYAAPPATPPTKPKPAKAPKPQEQPPQPAPAAAPKGQYFDNPPAPGAQQYQQLPVAPAKRGEGQVLNRANAARQLPRTDEKPAQPAPGAAPTGQYFDNPPAPGNRAPGTQRTPAASEYGSLTVAPPRRGEGQVLNRTDATRQLPVQNRSGNQSGQYDRTGQPLDPSATRYQRLPGPSKSEDSPDTAKEKQ